MNDGLRIPDFHPVPVNKPVKHKESKATRTFDKVSPWVAAILTLIVVWLACFA